LTESIVEIFNNEYTPVVSSVNGDFEGVLPILMSSADIEVGSGAA
jgi:hypothetical protein